MNNSRYKIGLFIPCYIDQFYPNVAISTLELLEKLGCEVEYPLDQTCCGQPFTNAGYADKTHELGANFISNFEGYDYVVCPSGSCVHYVKTHLESDKNLSEVNQVKAVTYELVTFLNDVLKVEAFENEINSKVGIHHSCHGLRGLRSGKASELMLPSYNKTHQLLQLVKGLEIQDLHKVDECCGFGGTFAIGEEAISVSMGNDRIEDHLDNGVDVIVGNDMSCLMHMEGLIRKQKKPVTVRHVAEILNEAKQ